MTFWHSCILLLHMPPYDGATHWETVMHWLCRTDYPGLFMFEVNPKFDGCIEKVAAFGDRLFDRDLP